MPWRRFLFCLWLVASLAWVALVSILGYSAILPPRNAAQAHAHCVESRRTNPELGNLFDCFDGPVRSDDLLPLGPQIASYAVIAVIPPLGALLLFMVGVWVFEGLSPRSGERETSETGGSA